MSDKPKKESPYMVRYHSELPISQRYHLGLAAVSITTALASSRFGEVQREAEKAQRYLEEALDEINNSTSIGMTQEDANLSQAIHTWLRKGMDSPWASMLWQFVNTSKGRTVWVAFIKGARQGRYDLREAMSEAEKAYGEDSRMDNLYMWYVLQMWDKADWTYMIKAFKSSDYGVIT